MRSMVLFVSAWLASSAVADDTGVDPVTGLVLAPGQEQVAAHCSGCHSLALVQQNRGDAEHWLGLIRWMQAKHNLWELGPAEAPIVAYLAKHYGAPAIVPRRRALETTWLEEPSP